VDDLNFFFRIQR